MYTENLVLIKLHCNDKCGVYLVNLYNNNNKYIYYNNNNFLCLKELVGTVFTISSFDFLNN